MKDEIFSSQSHIVFFFFATSSPASVFGHEISMTYGKIRGMIGQYGVYGLARNLTIPNKEHMVPNKGHDFPKYGTIPQIRVNRKCFSQRCLEMWKYDHEGDARLFSNKCTTTIGLEHNYRWIVILSLAIGCEWYQLETFMWCHGGCTNPVCYELTKPRPHQSTPFELTWRSPEDCIPTFEVLIPDSALLSSCWMLKKSSIHTLSWEKQHKLNEQITETFDSSVVIVDVWLANSLPIILASLAAW